MEGGGWVGGGGLSGQVRMMLFGVGHVDIVKLKLYIYAFSIQRRIDIKLGKERSLMDKVRPQSQSLGKYNINDRQYVVLMGLMTHTTRKIGKTFLQEYTKI